VAKATATVEGTAGVSTRLICPGMALQGTSRGKKETADA
jgi:hypothetical protein